MPASRTLKLCFYSFSLAQIISIFGDRLHQFSVIGMIGRIAPGSSPELFQFALFINLPVLLFSPIFGSIIDRSNKVAVLIVVDIVRGFIVLSVPFLFYQMNSLYAFYVPVFFVSIANLMFAPAKSAVIPELFGTLRLLQINAVLWGLGIVGTLGGFIVGGWLIDFHSWEWSFYTDGGSYLISVLFLLPLLLLPRRKAESAKALSSQSRSGWMDLIVSIKEGFGLIRTNRVVGFSLTTQGALFGALGVLYVIGIAHLQTVFPEGKTIYLSAVAGAATVGLLAGSLLATMLRGRLSTDRSIAGSTIALAISWVGLAVSRHIVPVTLWALLLGISISPIIVITETLLQVHTPVDFRGRVFSTREILTKVAFLVTSSLATLLSVFVGKPIILIAIGVLLAVTGLVLETRKFLKI